MKKEHAGQSVLWIESNRTSYGLDINQTRCIMDQNVIVPTVFGEKKRTKIKGTKYFWTNIVWTKYCMGKK